MHRHLTSIRRLLLPALVTVIAVTAVGCSSSKKSSAVTAAPAAAAVATTTPPAAAAPATTAPATTTPTTAAPAVSGLGGTWNGSYSGAYNGTFVLNWTQTGSSLLGTIKLSSPLVSLSINGSVTGSTIQFGTVGGAVSYTGTISGSSMSGKYQVGTDASKGGSWSASQG